MTNFGWFNTRGKRLFGWLMCMLLVFSMPTALASSKLFDGFAVPDDMLDELRGGFFAGNGQEISFAVTRTVAIDGQVVLMQTLVLNNIPALLSQAAPSVEGAIGTLAVVQNGLGNAIDAATHALSQSAAGATPAPASTATPPAAGPAPPPPAVSPATDVATSVANTGHSSKATGVSDQPALTVSNAPTVATIQVQPPANSSAAAQSAARSSKATGVSDQPALTVSNAPTVATIQVQPPANSSAAAQPAANGSASLTTYIVAGGRTIVVPNGPAMAAAIQNSVNNTRIQVMTDISANMATLSQLGALLRQQAVAASRR